LLITRYDVVGELSISAGTGASSNTHNRVSPRGMLVIAMRAKCIACGVFSRPV
jgi:hypothetical protein